MGEQSAMSMIPFHFLDPLPSVEELGSAPWLLELLLQYAGNFSHSSWALINLSWVLWMSRLGLCMIISFNGVTVVIAFEAFICLSAIFTMFRPPLRVGRDSSLLISVEHGACPVNAGMNCWCIASSRGWKAALSVGCGMNGTVEWNGGMERWNGMTTPTERVDDLYLLCLLPRATLVSTTWYTVTVQ